jgi:hypothetical protein
MGGGRGYIYTPHTTHRYTQTQYTVYTGRYVYREKLKYCYHVGGMDRPSHSLFCQDLKEYLERYIDVAKRYKRCCVAVLLRRMLRREGRKRYHAPYSKYLKNLFSRYMFGRGIYIIPLEDAQNVLTSIDTLCESLRQEKRYQPKEREKMERASIKLPKAMIEELNKYAKAEGIKRAEVVRRAVEEMLKKYRGLDTNSAGLKPH